VLCCVVLCHGVLLPPGRGYKLAPTSFTDLYRRFGRSHFYFGAVLLQYGVACIAAGHLNGAELFVLWAQFLVVVSLLFGPFWFTPFAFRTTLVSVSAVTS
jgi:1,3-beta-glucan synthase